MVNSQYNTIAPARLKNIESPKINSQYNPYIDTSEEMSKMGDGEYIKYIKVPTPYPAGEAGNLEVHPAQYQSSGDGDGAAPVTPDTTGLPPEDTGFPDTSDSSTSDTASLNGYNSPQVTIETPMTPAGVNRIDRLGHTSLPMTPAGINSIDKIPTSVISSGSDSSLLQHIRASEAKWDTIENIHDGAGLSIGAYQFTENSGMAKVLARRLGVNGVRDITPQLLNSSRGREIQTQLFKDTFVTPAIKVAKKYGITDQDSINFLIDTNLNGGMMSVIHRAKRKRGGITFENLKQARIDRYNSLIRRNPRRYSKFRRGWINRVHNFKRGLKL